MKNASGASEKQIARNVLTLQRYRRGNKTEKEFYRKLISKGRLFVVSGNENGYSFAPSRFVGYQSNTMELHAANRQTDDGRLTNQAINKILGESLDKAGADVSLYKRINKEFVDYCRDNNIVPAKIPNSRRYWLLIDLNQLDRISRDRCDAIDDIGTDEPNTQIYVTKRYLRDAAVRDAVRQRANGKCEYCQKPGFLNDTGQRYLECHHIIALANDGEDRTTNVIALCANHHRMAHFGKQRHELERIMISKIIAPPRRGSILLRK